MTASLACFTLVLVHDSGARSVRTGGNTLRRVPLTQKVKQKFGFFLFSFYICSRKVNISTMSKDTMIQKIAHYFETQPVLKAWLFGSYSRGEQREDSDVDILILPDKTQHFSLFTLSEIYEDLKELLGCEVDLITEGGLMPFARESADRDKILIYERAA